jgi:alpha-amylase
LIELAPGQYTWRVQAVDASGRPGPWSTDAKPGADSHGYLPYKFTVQPERPDLLAPTTPVQVSAAGFRSLVFAWKPVSHAVQYRWQLSPSQSFSPISASQTTVMTRWAPLVTFADGHYYWRVQALDSSGSVLSSSTNSFELTKDATAPTATAVSPTFALGITSPVTVTFSEPVSGVTTTAFRLVPQGATGSAPGSVTTAGTTATWKPSTALVPGQTYAVDLGTAIVDAFGNPLTPKSFTIRTDTQVDNTSPALVEHWDRDSAKSALGGSYDASKSTGSSASYRFTGTSVSVLGTRMKSGGYAAVYLDGKKQTSTASFYGAKTQYRKVVWSKSGLANSAHTVQVRVLGTKPRAASDHWVYLDGFGVGRTQVDQANAAVTEAFTRTKMSNATGGSYDTASHTTSGDSAGRPSYSVQFRGTGVAAYGVKSRSASKAAVYLDGKLKSTVDLRSTSTYVTTIASFTGLADKVHTLRIDVVGTKTGTGSAVGLDYVRIS